MQTSPYPLKTIGRRHESRAIASHEGVDVDPECRRPFAADPRCQAAKWRHRLTRGTEASQLMPIPNLDEAIFRLVGPRRRLSRQVGRSA